MENKMRYRLTLGITGIIFVVMFLVPFMFKPSEEFSRNKVRQTLELGKMYRSDDDTEISLPAHVTVDGELRLYRKLSYEFPEYDMPYLIVKANHTFLTIYLDGEIIYKINPKEYSLGNYYVRVPLPRMVTDAKLEIALTVPPNGIHRVEVPDIVISNEGYYTQCRIEKDLSSLIISLLIFFSGLFNIGLAVVNRKLSSARRMFIQGFFAMDCAIYFLCETYTVVYLYPAARTIYYLDMLSFSLLMPLLMAVVIWNQKGWKEKLAAAGLELGLLNVVIQLVVGITGIMELRKTILLTHITQFIAIMIVAVLIISRLGKQKKKWEDLLSGIIIVGGLLDLVLFYLEMIDSNVFFFKIAILIYFVIQLYRTISFLMEQSAEAVKENYYKTIAMYDTITGCFSRAAFELERTTWDKYCIRTIFSLDLNDLKKANDLYGHKEGDLMIQGISSILSSVFSEEGKCYRIGGDEFLVFCDHAEPRTVDRLLVELKQQTEEYNNQKKLHVPISFAVGVSSTAETGGNLDQAIERADERMYDNKNEIKQNVKNQE